MIRFFITYLKIALKYISDVKILIINEYQSDFPTLLIKNQ